jgi:hypothetical protein
MRLTQDIIRKLIKEQLQEALNNQEREDKINAIVVSLSNLDDADVNYILSQVRNRLDEQEPANRDDELDEVYSEKQRRWACAQAGESRKNFKGTPSLTATEAEEMCGAEIEKK